MRFRLVLQAFCQLCRTDPCSDPNWHGLKLGFRRL
jgi:hypothetical protein